MVKTLLQHVKEFKRDSLMTPMFMVLEVLMETLIPFLMASMIDNGVEVGNQQYIFQLAALMVVLAVIGLWAGIMGGKHGARASTGFARNLRGAMYNNIQAYSFSNIDFKPVFFFSSRRSFISFRTSSKKKDSIS